MLRMFRCLATIFGRYGHLDIMFSLIGSQIINPDLDLA